MNVSRSILRAPITILLLLTLLTTGCATIHRGPLQRIPVESDPPDATITTERCGVRSQARTTPDTVWVSRRARECTIRLSKPGWADASATLERRFDFRGGLGMQTVGNVYELIAYLVVLAATAVVSLAVDSVTGAIFVVDPPAVFLELEPAPDGQPVPSSGDS